MPESVRILHAVLPALFVLLPAEAAPAQSRPLFDTFAYPQPWTTPTGQFKPLPGAALVQSSPNLHWKKLVWATAPGWPLVDYLAENVTTTGQEGPSRLVLSVTPAAGPGLPVGGAEILADRNLHTFAFGSYRARLKASPPTPKGVGVCNAFYFWSSLCEIDVEFRSVSQARTPGTGQVEMTVHDFVSRPGSRVTLARYVNLSFDPTQEFHVYGFDWHPSRAEFFVDDRLVAVTRTGDLGTYGTTKVPVLLPDAANVIPDVIRLSNWTGLTAWTGAPPSVKTDFEVDWVSYAPFFFTASTTEISASAGGKAEFRIDAGAGRAGSLVLVLATPFETNLGLINPFRSSAIMPVEFDWILLPLMFELASRSSLHGFLSFLDVHGQGSATFILSPHQVGPELSGTRLHFACLTLHPFFNIIQACSNRVRVDLVR